jgi:thiazole synthase
MNMEDFFELAGQKFRSRLIVGTGKYKDFAETKKAIEVSGAEIVTVAVRRVNITDPRIKKIFSITSIRRNTPSCPTPPAATTPTPCAPALARGSGVSKYQLEVIGDSAIPDVPATLVPLKSW